MISINKCLKPGRELAINNNITKASELTIGADAGDKYGQICISEHM
jgi:hypothetical protein